ncbi:hypothetical protein [Pararhizobium gei]|uniref:hypothetical protein n=1 Tax=Pararhizobium gei TaxID=1395951 RepID=UPI0023DB156B|nr:hypothetical protein [Rhizobium gei]
MQQIGIKSRQIVSSNPDTSTSHLFELVGAEAFEKLQRECGGLETRFPDPRRLSDDHWLTKAVGWDAAKAISETFACEQVYIPALPIDHNAGRAEYIRAAANEGKTSAEVAQHLGISNRWLRTLLKTLGLQGIFKNKKTGGNRVVYFHIDPARLNRFETVAGMVRRKEMTPYQGARRLSVSESEFALVIDEHRKSGSLEALLKPTPVYPANSNGPLTGLAANSGTLPHPANENRVSGA